MTYLLRGAADIDTTHAIRVTVDSPFSSPCRRCLEDAVPGEDVLLTSYDPFDRESPYRCASPVFVHARDCTPYTGQEIPDQQRRRLLSVRAFDSAAMMTDADVTEGTGLAQLLDKLFADPATDFVHVHNARPGCFAVRVDRALVDQGN